MCPLFIAANIIASLTGRVLCGSYHAGVLSLVAVCWCAITFNWSKCIWGTFISGRILIGSLSTNVIVVCFVEDRRDAAIYISIAAMVSTGEWSIATMIAWRKVDLHLGIRAAGWNAIQDWRLMWLLSVLCIISRPRVGWFHLMGIVILTDAPNGLDDNSKSIGLCTVVECIIGAITSSGSGGMKWVEVWCWVGVIWLKICIGGDIFNGVIVIEGDVAGGCRSSGGIISTRWSRLGMRCKSTVLGTVETISGTFLLQPSIYTTIYIRNQRI